MSKKIGFIGLGNVGGKLAGSLLRNGFDLTVRDLNQEISRPFLDNGAKVKITIQMRGRENANKSDVFTFFKEAIETHLVNFKYDSNLALNGSRIIGVLFKDG